MNRQTESLKKTRMLVLGLVHDLSNEQLNRIPDGFSNNIIWNLAHLIAAQQGVCYKRAGLPVIVDDAFFEAYKPGSRPERTVSADEVTQIKELAISTIDHFESDYAKGMFAAYPAWTTRYGVELTSIDDALQFLSFHEGMHTGYIMALKRVTACQLV